MRALLDNRFAPVTFRWGFVESPIDEFARAFIQWQERLDEKFGTHTERKSLHAPFMENLLVLEPLSTPADRYLLVETRSKWSAIFSNGLRVNDVNSPVAYLPTVLGCRGLEVACVPDRSKRARGQENAFQIWGNVCFALYGATDTDWLNRIRSVSVSNDVSGWEFVAEGEAQPWEQTENYAKRRIADRFTPEMLNAYCSALGINLFDDAFYGQKGLLLHYKRAVSYGPRMSIAEARKHLFLD